MKHLKRIVTALTTAALVVCAILFLPQSWFMPVILALMVATMIEFFMLAAKKTSVITAQGFLVNLAGILIISFAFATLLVIATNRVCGGNRILLYVLAAVKLSDMGGFALGVAFGKHKMCPSISPNKSWEGMFGSVLGSCLVSCAFIPVTHYSVVQSLAIGVAAAVFGTTGDLVESKFKRWVGVKDSGTFMPAGLGGLLDMVDSLLFAPWVIWTIIRIGI